MDSRLEPANVDAGDLPTGFSATDPSGSSASTEKDVQAQQLQVQKDAILQQALTPEALERLRRIKVSSMCSSEMHPIWKRQCIHVELSLTIPGLTDSTHFSLSRPRRPQQLKTSLHLWQCKESFQEGSMRVD